MELHILYRRTEQRMEAKGIVIEANWIGHYCTSLDTVDASISFFHLDKEMSDLLAHPCEMPLLRIGRPAA